MPSSIVPGFDEVAGEDGVELLRSVKDGGKVVGSKVAFEQKGNLRMASSKTSDDLTINV